MTPVLTDPRLIVGLDLPSIEAARAMVDRLGATVSAYKVGLTLLARPGGVAFVSFVCFALTGPLRRMLGDGGMAVIVRVLGLILCALAIQFILAGLSEAIPGMFSSIATTPYPDGGH